MYAVCSGFFQLLLAFLDEFCVFREFLGRFLAEREDRIVVDIGRLVLDSALFRRVVGFDDGLEVAEPAPSLRLLATRQASLHDSDGSVSYREGQIVFGILDDMVDVQAGH